MQQKYTKWTQKYEKPTKMTKNWGPIDIPAC